MPKTMTIGRNPSGPAVTGSDDLGWALSKATICEAGAPDIRYLSIFGDCTAVAVG
jgi:hypothetical protein